MEFIKFLHIVCSLLRLICTLKMCFQITHISAFPQYYIPYLTCNITFTRCSLFAHILLMNYIFYVWDHLIDKKYQVYQCYNSLNSVSLYFGSLLPRKASSMVTCWQWTGPNAGTYYDRMSVMQSVMQSVMHDEGDTDDTNDGPLCSL